jgi:hypothetical protein
MNFSDKVIDKKEELLDEFQNLTLEEISIKIKKISYDDTDLIAKIACLAARVDVLNQRIKAIVEENTINDNVIETKAENSTNIVEKLLKPNKTQNNLPIEWVRVQIKETTEVNGVRFPSGIQIDVTYEDSKKMIESGKAILLEDLVNKEN